MVEFEISIPRLKYHASWDRPCFGICTPKRPTGHLATAFALSLAAVCVPLLSTTFAKPFGRMRSAIDFVTPGRDSSVGIATRYGLDGPGIESQWGRDFLQPSRPDLGLTQPSIQWVPGLSRGYSDRGVTLTTHPIRRRG